MLRIVSLLSTLTLSASFNLPSAAPKPSAKLSPLDVVQSQMTALQQGNVQRCFEFASPNNKKATGPWQRFEMMVRQTPAYAPLVSCSSFEIVSALTFSESQWRCRVLVRPAGGSSAPAGVASPILYYNWMVSKQAEDPVEGFWMVDSVMPEMAEP